MNARAKRVTRLMLHRMSARLPFGVRLRLLSELAANCGVVGFGAQGQLGTIWSSSSDRVVFEQYLRTGAYESGLTSLLYDFFERAGGGTYLDIGANIGLTTIPIARNHSVKCVAFEPEPATFTNLTANIAVNCPGGNVRAMQIAVFDRASTLDFEVVDSGNMGDHRIRLSRAPGAWHEESRKVIRVPAATLDDLIGEVRRPLAIKIDTQGAEPFVFAGGKDTLARTDLVVFEWWPYGMHRLDADPAVVSTVLKERFAWASVAGERKPIDEICERMLIMAAKECNNPTSYVDVVAGGSGF